jgi:hypothetical protein
MIVFGITGVKSFDPTAKEYRYASLNGDTF